MTAISVEGPLRRVSFAREHWVRCFDGRRSMVCCAGRPAMASEFVLTTSLVTRRRCPFPTHNGHSAQLERQVTKSQSAATDQKLRSRNGGHTGGSFDQYMVQRLEPSGDLPKHINRSFGSYRVCLSAGARGSNRPQANDRPSPSSQPDRGTDRRLTAATRCLRSPRLRVDGFAGATIAAERCFPGRPLLVSRMLEWQPTT